MITTATDVGGRFSPDSFAKANGLVITDLGAAKKIASAVLDGEIIGLLSEPAILEFISAMTMKKSRLKRRFFFRRKILLSASAVKEEHRAKKSKRTLKLALKPRKFQKKDFARRQQLI